MTGANIELAGDVISLTGGQNFREVGGYPTADGRTLRRGQIWRSARLDELTEADIEIVNALELRTVADLRRPSERAQNPTSDRILQRVLYLAWESQGIRDLSPQETLFKPNAGEAHYFDAIIGLYRMIAEEHTVQFAELLNRVAEGDLPILIHCAAGKDRTGIAVALLLEALGVPRDFIWADYAKTEQLLNWERLTSAAALGTGADSAWLENMDPGALKLLIRADARYLKSAFDDLDARYGSVMNFMSRRLGATPSLIEQLRIRLLQD